MFTGQVEQRDGDVVISVPEREIELGDLEIGESYRVAMLDLNKESKSGSSSGSTGSQSRQRDASEAPVEEGELREVEIEDTGDQGDGIARIGPGYIVFVPGTSEGDRVTVEITKTRENFAFGEVVEDEPISG